VRILEGNIDTEIGPSVLVQNKALPSHFMSLSDRKP